MSVNQHLRWLRGTGAERAAYSADSLVAPAWWFDEDDAEQPLYWNGSAWVEVGKASSVSGTIGRVAQFAAGGAAVEDANLVGPAANLLTLAATVPATLTVPESGTVGLLGTAQTWTATNVFDGGFVGIGVDPSYKLHIEATASNPLYVRTTTGTVGTFETSSNATTGNYGVAYLMRNADTTTNNGVSLLFSSYDSGGSDWDNAAGIACQFVARGTGVSGELVFMTGNNVSNPVERARINKDGYIGINKQIPLAQHHIQTNGAAVIGQIIQLSGSPSASALEVRAVGAPGAVLANITQTGGARYKDAIIGDGTNQMVVSTAGVVTLEGTAKRILTIRPEIDVVTQIAHAKPTEITIGVFLAYSFPIYAADNEELFLHSNVPGRWTGSDDITFHLLCAIGGAEDVGDYFKFQASWEVTHAGETVPVTSHNVEVEQAVLVGRNALNDEYELTFTIDYDADGGGNEIAAHDLIGIRLRRIDATNPDVANEVRVLDWHLHYPVDKMFVAP